MQQSRRHEIADSPIIFFENVCVDTKLITQASVIKALVDDVIKLFTVSYSLQIMKL